MKIVKKTTAKKKPLTTKQILNLGLDELMTLANEQNSRYFKGSKTDDVVMRIKMSI